MKLIYAWYAVGWLAIAAVGLFIFGPGVVAAFDLSCWFLLDGQCTQIVWTEGRKAWAALPWGLLVALLWLSAIA